MSLLLSAAGRALLVGAGKGLAVSGSGGAGGAGSFTGPYPTAISGCSGWYDGGALTGVTQSVAGANQPVSAIIDRSGNGNNITIANSGATNLVPWPRLNGVLMGLGRSAQPITTYTGCLYPWLSNPLIATPQNVQMGSASAWTRYLVYSRPNLSQAADQQNYGTPQTLLSIGGTPIIGLTSSGPGILDSLLLFPGSGQTVLSSSIARRHTHSITLRNTPGTGIDVWLDDVQVGSAITNPLGVSNAQPLQILSLTVGYAFTDAQCFFHEFAMWERALNATDMGTLLTNTAVVAPNSVGSVSKRWTRGTRAGVTFGVVGQSNAADFVGVNGAAAYTAESLRYYLGAISANFIGGNLIQECPVYQDDSTITNAWVANPGTGADPSTWAIGPMGTDYQETLAALNAADLADLRALFIYWSENDCILHGYAGKAEFNGAFQRMLYFMRLYRGASAAQFPVGWVSALPYGGTFNEAPVSGNTGAGGGNYFQELRENLADLVADSSLNVFNALPNTADCIGNGGDYDAATGLWTAGDNAHTDGTDNCRYGRIAGLWMARAVLASGWGEGYAEPVTSFPAGLPSRGGPQISHAYLENDTTVIVTIEHDAGNDLILPLQAPNAPGWVLIDGGTVAEPDTLLQATGCVRIDASHLRLTFPTITNSAANCQLFYDWGGMRIGRGDAVTDNYTAVTKPAGWDIGADEGALYAINYPIQASTYGTVLSASPT